MWPLHHIHSISKHSVGRACSPLLSSEARADSRRALPALLCSDPKGKHWQHMDKCWPTVEATLTAFVCVDSLCPIFGAEKIPPKKMGYGLHRKQVMAYMFAYHKRKCQDEVLAKWMVENSVPRMGNPKFCK